MLSGITLLSKVKFKKVLRNKKYINITNISLSDGDI